MNLFHLILELKISFVFEKIARIGAYLTRLYDIRKCMKSRMRGLTFLTFFSKKVDRGTVLLPRINNVSSSTRVS
jgi:hypothetical protein